MDRSAEKGWELLENGELIRRAEEEGYEVFVTTDQSMRYRQTLSGMGLAIVVLLSTAWPRARHRTEEIREVIEVIGPDGAPSAYVIRRSRLGRALLDVVQRTLRDNVLTHTKAAKLLGVKPGAVEPLLRRL